MTQVTIDGAGNRVIVTGGQPRVVARSAGSRVSTGGGMGVQGRPGVGIELRGVYATEAALIAAHPSGEEGDCYAVAGDLYTWDVDAGAWANAGSFRGPPGNPGQIRFTGHGAPGVVIGAEPNDTYLDLDTGDIYQLI